MCGIVGYLSQKMIAKASLVEAMASHIAHRGPDDSATWVDEEAGIALAHRRLSIIDLTEAGKQPMISADGRFVLIFNGEIYNHRTLRQKVDASGWSSRWRGHSDTETLLAALQLWGMEKTLPRLNGMFAFALWDRERRILSLARDRMGEKPLYYGLAGNSFLFGSELKALRAHPEWVGEVDRDVLALYLRHGYVPDPHCIIKGMAKLPPANWIEINSDFAGEPQSYWDLASVATKSRLGISDVEAVNELEARLTRAVALRMEADVPIGAFLSGGIDSSTVAALMQTVSTQPVRTFTIGFEVPGYNEAEAAQAIATHLGTQHTELYLTAEDALETIPELPMIWDEPFADSSQIPTLLLSRLTRRNVTVALSGDGGDELFCGYNRYVQGYRIHQALSLLPSALRNSLGKAFSTLPNHHIDSLLSKLHKPLQYPAFGDKLHKLGQILSHSQGTSYYRALVSVFREPEVFLREGTEPETLLSRTQEWPALYDFREEMMYLDSMSYLPGDILTKVDRASMAVSLEARVPMLDHELIEFAWQLPFDTKLRHGKSKWALRQVLERHVPRALTDRPKMGFGVPIEHWLSGPLRHWANELLATERLRVEGFFDADAVTRLWEEQLSGRRRWHHQLWAVLMFQSWLETFRRL